MEPKIDLDEVRALVKIASEADITELTVESPALKVSIKKLAAGRVEVRAASGGAAPAPVGTGGIVAEDLLAASEVVPNHMKTITAPMVGTFYRSPSPDAPPFVREGDTVEAGQTVCIIEAMKLFNEIQSEMRGRVVRILTENAVPVEYGQPLLLIEPLAS